MKRIPGFFFLLLLSHITLADIGLSFGASAWQTEATGAIDFTGPIFDATVGDLDVEKDYDIEDETQAIAWMEWNPENRWIPRFRLAYADITNTGTRSVAPYKGSPGELILDHYDFSSLYAVVDHEDISFDIGTTIRVFDGSLTATFDLGTATTPIDTTLFFIYTRTKVNLHGNRFWLQMDISGGETSSEKGIDADIKLDFRAFYGLGFQLGYRYMDIEMETEAVGRDTDGLTLLKETAIIEMGLEGPYLSMYYGF